MQEDGWDTWAAIAVLGGNMDTLEDLVAAGWLVPLIGSDGERLWSPGAIEAAVARAITEGWPGRGGRRPDRRSGQTIIGYHASTLMRRMKPNYEVRIEPIMVSRRGAIALCGDKERNLQDLEWAGWISAIIKRSGNYAYVVAELRAAVCRAQLEGWPGKGGRPGRGSTS